MNNSNVDKCETPRKSTLACKTISKTVIILVCVFLSLVLSYINLFRAPLLVDVFILCIIALTCLFVSLKMVFGILKQIPINFRLTTGRIILLIFIGSYLLSTVIRFNIEPNDKRHWSNIFGKSYMTAYEQKRLGIIFPKNTEFLYYDEGIDWLEQDVQLTAVIDQQDLSEITKLLEKVDKTAIPPNKFWSRYYKVNQKNELYEYSNNVQGRQVTASILLVYLDNKQAKLFMDIIYW